jgi:hypothetical protein
MDAVILGLVAWCSWVALISWRRRRRWVRVIELVRKARALLEGPVRYRRLTSEDGELARRLDASATVESNGFTWLGDTCMEAFDDVPVSIARWFVDGTGKVVASARITLLFPTPEASLHLATCTATDEFYTVRVKDPSRPTDVARPPFVHGHHVAETLSFDEMLAEHVAIAPAADAIVIADLDQLIDELYRRHERSVQWRRAQPPDDLLDQYVRAVLPLDSQAPYREMLARELRAELPTARTR